MRIEEKIKLDIKKSMLGKNVERLTLLRTIAGEFNRFGKDISDEKAISIMKKMKDNATQFNNTFEISVLSEYLPEVLSENEVITIVQNMFAENSYTQRDMGTFMKEIKANHGSAIDMKLASETFKSLL